MQVTRVVFISLLMFTPQAFANTSVVDSLHNLSVTGPGKFKSQAVDDVCVFCHTPHAKNPVSGTWNRRSQPFITKYQSSTTDALPGRHTKTSELCLSCHDGTIALGELISPPKGRNFRATDLRSTFLTGRSRLSSNLSNHHPIAITYDASLVAADSNLANPNAIDLPLRNNELHCTSCHDPHASDIPPFLHKSTMNGELCISCHQLSGTNWDWATSAHAQSDATPHGTDPWKERKPEWKGRTTAENSCMSCHTPHNAATGARLINDVEEKTCYRCHNGSFAKGNIQSQSQKFFRHPVDSIGAGRHDSVKTENPLV